MKMIATSLFVLLTAMLLSGGLLFGQPAGGADQPIFPLPGSHPSPTNGRDFVPASQPVALPPIIIPQHPSPNNGRDFIAPATQPSNVPLVVTNADGGTVIVAHVGQVIKIKLENTHKGAGWEPLWGGRLKSLTQIKPELAKLTDPKFKACIDVGLNDFIPADKDDPMGVASTVGTYIWAFTATAAGEDKLDYFCITPGGPFAVQRLRSAKVAEFSVTVKVEAAATQPDISKFITDLSSEDGQVKVAATKAIFALGKDALDPLAKAGAKQISPFRPDLTCSMCSLASNITRRIDMVYSLLEGLKPNPVSARKGYELDGFGISVEKDCTQEDVAKIGERHGFTIDENYSSPSGTPSCYVQLKPGKNLADVLKAVLSEEPKVISVNLIYFVS